ncbi:MAG: hypothetical protein WDN75_20735 [Bacteroidota bacterium]
MKTKAPAKRKTSGEIKNLSLTLTPKKLKRPLSNGNGHTENGHRIVHEDFDSTELLRVLTEVKNGNFTERMPIDGIGVSGKIYDTLNEIISLNEKMMLEFTKAGDTIGKQGKLTQRIESPSSKGSWSEGVNSLNVLISDLVHPTIEIAHVISSVAKGNLSQEMPEEIGDHKLEGEFLRIAKEVNYMVKQLNLFSMEVTRVAREVGSEGKLGGQAKVKGVGGVWKDLTDSVNHMAGNLTNQVRNIAEVTTAIARGIQDTSTDAVILNFDAATGAITFDKNIPNSGVGTATDQSIYDIEWSVNGSFLYLSRFGETGVAANVLQFDYNNPSSTLISVLPAPCFQKLWITDGS